MSRILKNTFFHALLALIIGLGLGLFYSWRLSPVTYVDANPSILRSDFKDLYRTVIADAYAANHDLARASARLTLLGDADPIGELSAQAQRMVAAGEPLDKVNSLTQLVTDLTRGYASNPNTPTPFPTFNTPVSVATSTLAEAATELPAEVTETPITQATAFFEQTPLIPVEVQSATPKPTITPTRGPGSPFALVGQDTVCDPGLPHGLMQFILMDTRRRQIAGIEIVVTWNQGEDRFFTGFKPELGDGYADFIMEADTTYNIQIVTGGSFVPNITAPTCTDPNNNSYLGGLLLTFQQP